MCGFFALCLNRPLTPADLELGRAATLALAHRGPDGEGEWLDAAGGVYFGHRRLSIIDLSDASAQPMVGDGSVLAYNGEIYNFQTLRQRLQGQGAVFRSSGDTEVVLQAWRHWGADCLDRLDGMFAFALWDGARVHAATDAFGEKPLYCAQVPDGVYLSSELPPLVSALRLSPDLSGDRLTELLTLGCIPAPETAYPMVRRAPAASLLRIERGELREARRYWTAEFGAPGRGRPKPLSDTDLDRIESVLTESIGERLHADVPVCNFLSSGVDSALVAALASRRLGRQIPCITVAFPQGRVVNEAPAAAQIAAHLGVEHQVLTSGEVGADPAGDVLSLFGQPSDNITVLAVREMSRLARRDFTVALSGLGGDELFFGYRKHEQTYRLRRYLETPEPLRLAVGAVADRLRGLQPRLAQYADLAGVADRELYVAQKTYGIVRWLRRVPGWEDWSRRHFAAPAVPVGMIAPRYDLQHTMPDSLLPAQDLGSMRESLELRCPFLSRRLLHLLAGFDPRSFLAFGRKSVLYRLLYRHVPPSLLHGNKYGFFFPPDRFLAAFGERPPQLPSLDDDAVAEAWAMRDAGDGWRRLCVRLAMAGFFSAAA